MSRAQWNSWSNEQMIEIFLATIGLNHSFQMRLLDHGIETYEIGVPLHEYLMLWAQWNAWSNEQMMEIFLATIGVQYSGERIL